MSMENDIARALNSIYLNSIKDLTMHKGRKVGTVTAPLGSVGYVLLFGHWCALLLSKFGTC